MPIPTLAPLSPDAGGPISLGDQARLVIGSNFGSDHLLAAPGIAPMHAVITVSNELWTIAPINGTVQVNDAPVVSPARLQNGDRVTLAPDVVFEFRAGERRTRRMASVADMRLRARPRRRFPKPPGNLSLVSIGVLLAGLVVLVGGGVALWHAVHHPAAPIAVLTDRQAAELDSLLVASDDHVERGGTLLELGLGEGAAQEFAQAVDTLQLSDLRTLPQVRPRIAAIEASVAQIYRARALAVPENYAHATAPLTPEQLKTASLTVDEFAAKYALMSAAFSARFGHDIVVSGRDHPEHVALYGKGGAMDLSIKTMNRTEVAFLIDRAHALHIRIKDFSQDSILRREVQTAIRAGLLFEAGTGLHLHIDRFANRRDRWTTLVPFPRRRRVALMAPALIAATTSAGT